MLFLHIFHDLDKEVATSFITNETEERIINSDVIIPPLDIHEHFGLMLIYCTGQTIGQMKSYDLYCNLTLGHQPQNNSFIGGSFVRKPLSKSSIIECLSLSEMIPGL